MYHLQRNEMYRLGDNAQKSYVVHRRLTFDSPLVGICLDCFLRRVFLTKNISNKSTFNHLQYRQFCTDSKIFLWCTGYFCNARAWALAVALAARENWMGEVGR